MHGNEDSLICSGLSHCDTNMTFIRYEVLRALARAPAGNGRRTAAALPTSLVGDLISRGRAWARPGR